MIDRLRAAGLLGPSDHAAFVQTGHFRYESGHHGDTWLALDRLFVDPKRLRRAAARLADRLRPHAPDLVCGPLLGGALVGLLVAEQLDAAFVVAMPEPTTGSDPPTYALPAGSRDRVRAARVAIVDDAVNLGAATLAAARAIEEAGGRVVVVGTLVVRTPGPADARRGRGLPIEFLVGLGWNVWPAADCPLCRASVPIDAST